LRQALSVFVTLLRFLIQQTFVALSSTLFSLELFWRWRRNDYPKKG